MEHHPLLNKSRSVRQRLRFEVVRDEPTTVAVISPERPWIVTLRSLLAESPGIAVSTIHSTNVESAIRGFEKQPPKLIVLDARGDSSHTVITIERAAEACPGAGIVAVVQGSTLGTAIAALLTGALGIITQAATSSELSSALEAIRRGELYLSQSILHECISAVSSMLAHHDIPPRTAFETLSDREAEVVDLLTRGMSNTEIAHSLCLSEAAVKVRLSGVMSKWEVHNRVQVAVKALCG